MSHPLLQASEHDLAPERLTKIEARTQELGRELFRESQARQPSLLQRRWWEERLMSWTMQDEALKTQLFRFVDVLPMLGASDAVAGHLREYLDQSAGGAPWLMNAAVNLAQQSSLVQHALATLARFGAGDYARRFIAGENVQEVLQTAREQRRLKRCFTLDILGEAVASDQEATAYFDQYRELISSIAPRVNQWESIDRIDQAQGRALPRMNLSIKLSALDSQFDPIDTDGVTERVGGRLRVIFRLARAQAAFINVDMESYDKKDLTLHIFRSVLMEPEFRDWSDVGVVIQCYLVDAEADLLALRDWARERGTPVWVRLVKGAYWDYETIHAQALGWPVPVYQQKWQSDANFERLTRLTLQSRQHLQPAFGSHNLRSLAHAVAVAEHLELPRDAIEIQMLYGMADAEKEAFVDRDYRVRVYMPYGELIPGMAYLVRRLLENTSNDSFLQASHQQQVPLERLLADPRRLGRLAEADQGSASNAG